MNPSNILLTRRQSLKMSLGLSYTLAAGVVSAQTIVRTNLQGLLEERVNITNPKGGTIPCYVARPQGKTALPVMLVVSEIFGVHAYIADVARRFAHLGFLAIAPELFSRQGDPSKYTDIQLLFSDIINKVPDEQVMSDLDACVLWASQNDGNINNLAINGFCWGGRIVWLYSARKPSLNIPVPKTGIAWYGRLLGASSANQPKHPMDLTENLNCPILGLYAEQDTGIKSLDVLDFQDKLKKSNNKNAQDSKVVLFPKVGHAFHADYRPSYDADAATAAWNLMLDWLTDKDFI